MSYSGDGESSSSAVEPTGAGATVDATRILDVAPRARPSRVSDLLEGRAPGSVKIGRYVVLRRLGRGGMGVVYLAYDTELDRRVAIKLLATRRADASLGRARLKREAQALARLSHPNVVQIYEVGEHDGRVFVAMEYIAGQTLRLWLRARVETTSWRARLEVLLAAGEGLAAAHAAGLVHRDFKPDNVIVGDDRRVRVLDFGLVRARAVDDADVASGALFESLDRPLDDTPSAGASDGALALTDAKTLLGTPAYMAPEQFRRGAVDARADQFSFCVALYEGLYGARPYSARRVEQLRAAVELGVINDPPARARVPGWLHRVILRGLAPKPDDRWPDMRALLDTLARDRGRRRRQLTGVVTLVATAGAAGYGLRYLERDTSVRCEERGAIPGSAWSEERAAAIERAMLATELVYAGDTWARARPRLEAYASAWSSARVEGCLAARAKGLAVRDQLSPREACLEPHLAQLEALVDVFADADARVVQKAMSAIDQLPSIERCADDELRGRLTPTQPAVAASVEELRRAVAKGEALTSAGRFEPARELLLGVTRDAEALDFPPARAEALSALGYLQLLMAEYRDAEESMYAAWRLAEASKYDELRLASALHLVEILGDKLGRFDEARVWVGHVDALIQRRGGDAEAEIKNLGSLAIIEQREGNYERAHALYEQLLARSRDRYGERSLQVVFAHDRVGSVLKLRGEYAAARSHLELALALVIETLGPSHPRVLSAHLNLAVLEGDSGDFAAAGAQFGRALEVAERSLGPEHASIAYILNGLGINAQERGDLPQARAHLERALAIRERALGPEHPLVASLLNNLAGVLAALDDAAGAEAMLNRALGISERGYGPKHPKVAFSLMGLGELFLERGELARAEPPLRRALEIREAALGPEHPKLGYPLVALAELALARQRHEDAITLSERALAIREVKPTATGDKARTRFVLARALWVRDGAGDRERANELAAQAKIELMSSGPGSKDERAAIEAWLAERG